MFRRLCFGIVAVAVLAPAVWAQTADEIIAKNIQARGGSDKLKSVQSDRKSTRLNSSHSAKSRMPSSA